MAPRRKNVLPKELPDNFILTDTEKRNWRLGRKIGEGGFGRIYLASRDVDRPVAEDTDFVIKVEYQENGPLFSELKFYQRAAKPENRRKWMTSRKLDFLGIPTYWGTGLAECNGLSYRFMVMDRLGSDLQKVWKKEGQPQQAAVLQLGQGLLDVLEYIHENEYVHADIKAANLMQGPRDPAKVYLVDYGLSYRYCPDGVHKEYKENPKKCHNGTIEYTSLDAHKGLSPSRRGDLQILGFCLLHWLCGSLPWDHVLSNPAQVQEAKTRLMENLPDSVQQLSLSSASTDQVADFLLYVRTLGYQDKPDYKHLRELLTSRGGRARPDSPPESAGQSSTREGDPHTREQQRTAGSRPVTDEVQEGTKSKAVPARYLRGPPLNKPQPQKEKTSPAARRKQRPRPEPAQTDKDQDEDTRPRPIPALYLRGPPIGPRAQSKQKTRPQQSDGPTVTSASQGRGTRRKHTNQTHLNGWERWDDHSSHHDHRDDYSRHRDHRDDYSHHHDHRDDYSRHHDHRDDYSRHRDHRDDYSRHHDHRGRSRDWDRSALTVPGQEVGPTHRRVLLDWLILVGIFLFLGICVSGSRGLIKSI